MSLFVLVSIIYFFFKLKIKLHFDMHFVFYFYFLKIKFTYVFFLLWLFLKCLENFKKMVEDLESKFKIGWYMIWIQALMNTCMHKKYVHGYLVLSLLYFDV